MIENQSLEILFAIRTMIHFDFTSTLLENGTGASFIAQRTLQQFSVPTALAAKYPRLYARYRFAVQKHQFEIMCEIESKAAQHLQKQCELLPLYPSA